MSPKKKAARGFEAQRSRREWERQARIDAIAFARCAKARGLTRTQAARGLRLNAQTLAGWEKRWRTNRLAVKPRGRPLEKADRITRECILAVYYLAGPGIGLPTLRSLFPTAPRNDLEEILRRLQSAHLHKGGYIVHTLRWYRPGGVWALDHLEPPRAVDARYPYVLAVRDLASGFQLQSLPVETKGASEVVQALESLFKQHGPPLVLKSDWGFAAHEITDCLQRYRVLHL